MPFITNYPQILNGYIVDFPTIKCVYRHFNLRITQGLQKKLVYPQFLPKKKAGTVFSVINNVLGFDVPVLIKSKQKSKGVIAILGQDALRDPKELSNYNTLRDIILGLPYAIAFYSNYKQVALYHRLIKDILDSGYDVYLTDIWKSWDINKQSRFGSWNSSNPHYNCLKCEFTNFQINYVILMGGIAQNKFNALKLSLTTIPINHLSPSANGKWTHEHLSATQEGKIEYVKSKLRENGIDISIER